jgi:hypothetical protein
MITRILLRGASGAALLFATQAALAGSAPADAEATRLREELRATRAAFEARIAALESRLSQLEGAAPAGVVTERLDVVEQRLQEVEDVAASTPPPPPSAMNPQMSLILAGSWNNLSEDPGAWQLQGFMPGGEEMGPGERGFNLDESELTLSANIDPMFYGQATFAVTPENEVEVEEAFVRASALPEGITAQFGRFFGAVGYVNTQHAHAWDFADVPLVYAALFGGQYKTDGARIGWLAPLDTFLEIGAELGNGRSFPGADTGNGVGAWTLYAAVGDDIGASTSWKAGVAWLDNTAVDRGYEEPDRFLEDTANPTVFSGDSETWSAYTVLKWAPQGNSRERNLRLQAEYFARDEDGTLHQENARLGAGLTDYRGSPGGWYAQGVYQFRPGWRLGLRYDRVDSSNPRLLSLDGVLRPADYPTLEAFDPERTSAMLDWSPTEFSRLRLQYAREDSAPGDDLDAWYLQYLMSLGAHGAHAF